jgi:hypothetical protein
MNYLEAIDMFGYELDLDEMIQKNNSEEEPLPVDAMNVVINEFSARMLAKIATSLEELVKIEKSRKK